MVSAPCIRIQSIPYEVALSYPICFLISCSGNQHTQTTEETRKERSFQFPEIPVMLDTPDSRKAYLCEHYWDNFDFSDTAYIHQCKIFTYLHLPSANNDYICTQKEMNTFDVLYVNADDIYFSNHRLLDLAEKLVQLGLNY